MRGDIQALRAVAVVAVTLFHFFPGRVTGGYVGVDVFFVISGFLITGQLVRLRAQGRLKLGAFWAARARRLLPVSLFVLVATVIGTLLWAPEVLQLQYLRSVVASALYVENWQLAADAVDYLAAENAPPIAQHYWSLSAEEQFYIFWPLLIVAVPALTRPSRKRLLVSMITFLSVASFVLCVWATSAIPAFAYFATPVRLWEFGLGALVAVMPQFALPKIGRAAIWAIGWATLIATIVLYSSATPFPGYWALLPTAATAAIIVVGPEAPIAPARWVAIPPVRWVGDQSYGIYLWHWPVVVLAPAVLGHPMSTTQKFIGIALTVAIAATTKRLIEDPIRFGDVSKWRPRRTLFATGIAMVLVVATAAVPSTLIQQASDERNASAQGAVADPTKCMGAAAIWEDSCFQDTIVAASALTPTMSSLMSDTGAAYHCYVKDESAPYQRCTIGSTAPDAPRIALTGDSHAAMLVPALDPIGKSNGFSIDLFVGRGCVWSGAVTADCEVRQKSLTDAIADNDYAAVLVTGWNQQTWTPADRSKVAYAYATAWAPVIAEGTPVVALRDNPNVSEDAARCLATTKEFALTTCSLQEVAAMPVDPLVEASAISGANLIDLTPAYCRDGMCPIVAGGVIVYRDRHHITATFSKSLVPYLTPALLKAIPSLEQR